MSREKIQKIAQAPLPNFIVLGAMRAGTTSLHYNLARHPDVLMSHRKETNFFSDETFWKEGSAWYGKQFRKTYSKCIGESSPSYTRRPILNQTAKRMYELLPDLRLIYLVRAPLERSLSHYFHHLLLDGYSEDPKKSFSRKSPLISQSRYEYQLEPYQKYFRKSRIKVVKSEDLFDSPRETMSDIFSFLEINSKFFHPDFAIPHHGTIGIPPAGIFTKAGLQVLKRVFEQNFLLEEKLAKGLLRYFEKENQRFTRSFQVSADGWYEYDSFRKYELKYIQNLHDLIDTTLFSQVNSI